MNRRNKESALDFNSPIQSEIKDLDGVRHLFANWKIVPFFGTNDLSSDSFLNLLVKLAEISPTTSGCITSRRDFVAAGVELYKGKMEGFSNYDAPVQNLSPEDVEAFQNFLNRITGGEGLPRIKAIVERIHNNLDTCGNAFIEIATTTVAGEVFCTINVYDATECRYLLTEDGQPKRVLVSPSFDYYYLTKHPPTVIPVYPEFAESKGALRTLMHIKDAAVGRRWYGLNNSISSLYYQYLEYSNPEYLVTETHNRFTGVTFIEYEIQNDDTEDDLEEMDERFEETFTPKGESKSFLLSGRPKGADSTKVHQLKPNTNEKYHETIARLTEDKIVASFGWYTKLLYSRSNSGLSGDEMRSIFQAASMRVKPRQDKIASAINKALHKCAELMGEKDMADFYIKLASLYKLIFKDEIEANREEDRPASPSPTNPNPVTEPELDDDENNLD